MTDHDDSLPEDLATPSTEEALESEVLSLKEQVLRTMAELENYRKRAEREREETSRFAITGFARDLLSASDNLRRALDSATSDHEEPEKLLKSLLEGVAITEKELLAALTKHGVERIDPMGESFDHNLHQAMFESEESDQVPGMVVHVLQPGYRLYGRLLRPALVGVAKEKKQAE